VSGRFLFVWQDAGALRGLCLAVLLSCVAPALADEPVPTADAAATPPGTRAEQWRRLREEKRARLRPYRPSFLERNILAFEKAERPSILDFNVGGVYPRLGHIASGSRTAGGARLWHPDIGRSPLDVHGSAFFSLNGFEYYDLQLGLLPHRGRRFPPRSTKGDDIYELGDVQRSALSRVLLYGSLRYRHYPDTAFFGLGSDSRREDRTSYLHQDASYDLVAGYQLGARVAAYVRGGLLQAFVGRGESEDFPATQDLFDDRQAPGLLTQPDFVHLTGLVLLDYRDEPGNPHRGGMLALSASRYDDRGGDAFGFRRLAADARGYLPLGSPQRVLAARAYVSDDRASSGGRVPFYLQEILGGSHTLRAYPTYRLRGERLLLLQGEYRWEAWPALELAVFADAGKATSGGASLGDVDFLTDWGLGLRVKTFEATLFRLDWAKGNEGSRVLARFSTSF
jgi:hypothetical protein